MTSVLASSNPTGQVAALDGTDRRGLPPWTPPVAAPTERRAS